jgi:hypothetical protein
VLTFVFNRQNDPAFTTTSVSIYPQQTPSRTPILANGVFLMRRGSTPGIKPGRTALSRRDQPFRPLHPLRRVLKPSSGLLPRSTSQGVWLARWVPHHCDPDHPRCALVGDVRCRWLLHLAQSALACLHSCRVAQRPYRSCPPLREKSAAALRSPCELSQGTFAHFTNAGVVGLDEPDACGP